MNILMDPEMAYETPFQDIVLGEGCFSEKVDDTPFEVQVAHQRIRFGKASEQGFRKFYAVAQRMYAEDGDINKSSSYVTPDGYRYGQKLYEIRRTQADGRLDPDCQKKLDALGIIWGTQRDATISQKWLEMYELARQYRQTHGNLLVPSGYKVNGKELGHWIIVQRNLKAAGRLSAKKEEMLLAIDMVMDIARDGFLLDVTIDGIDGIGFTQININEISCVDVDPDWPVAYKALQAYSKAHGNIDVPVDYVTESGFPLGRWLAHKRNQYWTGELSGKEQMLLEWLDMDWSKLQVSDWETYLPVAQKYHEEKRTWDELSFETEKDGLLIGKWGIRQQSLKDTRQLTKAKKNALNNMNFRWRSKNSWENTVMLLKAFKQENGTVNVPASFIWNDIKVGSKVDTVRCLKRAGKLSPDQIAQMEAPDIAIDWEPSKTKKERAAQKRAASTYVKRPQRRYHRWEEALWIFDQYIVETGCVSVPSSLVYKDFGLGAWYYGCLNKANNGTLPDDRIEALSARGVKLPVPQDAFTPKMVG